MKSQKFNFISIFSDWGWLLFWKKMKISCLRTEAVHESISHALFNAPSYEIGDVLREVVWILPEKI